MEFKSFMEALKGKQHKIDKNKNGKVDSHDFELLRKEETEELEEATVKTQNYSWGTMKTVHHGSDFSIPLHPEHHKEIAKLKDQQEHKFKTEDGKHWTAKRSGDDVHFQGASGGNSTTVKHSAMSESVEDLDEIHRMKTKLNTLDDISNKSVARQKLSNLMKSGKARGALIANKRRTLNMGDDLDQTDLEQIEEKSDQAKQNKTMKNMMDASRGARYKLNNPVPDAEPEHKTAQAHNKAIGRALRNEDKMTTQKDKNGKLISFKYEGDWKKSTEKKEGSGKAANLAGQAMQKMAKANEQAPVAPVPDRKYIKGTPENKALKDSRKPINGMPTGKMKEEVEELDELSKSTLGSYAKKASRDSTILRKIGADFERKADAARSPGMKAASTELSNKYKSKSWSRRDGLDKAVDRLTKEETVYEAKDEQEYSYEGDMALNQLATLTRCAEMIKEILKPDTDMPEWVQSKITLATDYIQTAADYMHSEMNEAKSVEVKVNAAGDAAHEEKWEPVKKIKKPVKESFDDEGNLIANKVSYKEFMLEYTPGPGGVTQVKGRSYGASYTDPEGADDYDDKKPMKPAAEKRGRGRPAGAQSGARKNLGNSKLHSK